MSLRILVLGSGGREHALAWKLAQSELVQHIFVCPGNGGTSTGSKVSNVSEISGSDFDELVKWAFENKVCFLSSILFASPFIALFLL